MLLSNLVFTKIRTFASLWFSNKPTVTHQGDVAFSFALTEYGIDQTVK